MDSPRLSWELIEQVIDLSSRRPNTLCSLSLTCRQLRPRSRLVMFSHVQLESSDHVFAFVAFLLANPELRPFVHTVIVTPAAFGPSLLHILPNLASLECVDEMQLEEPEDEEDEDNETTNVPYLVQNTGRAHYVHRTSLNMHHTSLACFKRLGADIRTLRLNSVSFPTSLVFAQVLSAFSRITHLVCKKVQIKAAGSEAPLEVIRRRLSKQMQLKSLFVSVQLPMRLASQPSAPG